MVTLASGTLADLNLSSIAAVTSLGRSSLRLELREPTGALIGYLVLKAGRVVSATAGTWHGHEALRVLMNSPSDAQFRLDREPLDFVMSSALASVDELQELGRHTPRRPHRPPAQNSDRSGHRRLPTGTRTHLLIARDRKITRPAARALMMQGRLDELDLIMLLQALGAGRQLIELEIRDRAGDPLGALVVKSGKIVSAQSTATTGVGAIWELFTSPRSFQFSAFRVAGEFGTGQELASIAEISVSLARGRSERPDRVVVEGSLSEFDIPTLLQTLGCGRQYLALEIHDELTAIGTIFVKSGVVLGATTGELTGIEAVQQLLASPASLRFRLLRLVHEVPHHAPLGPVGNILLNLATVAPPPVAPAAAPATSRSPTVPVPPVPSPDEQLERGEPVSRVSRLEGVEPPATAEPVLMEGSLAEFELRTVLEVLSSTRQHARLQIFGPGNPALGELTVKGGRVLSAHAGTLAGAPALRFLAGVSRQLRFRVLTGREDLAAVQPLGTVGELLADLAPERARAPASESPRQLLRWALPIAVGGTLAFFIARGQPRAPVARNDAPVETMHVEPPAAGTPPAAAAAANRPPSSELTAPRPPRGPDQPQATSELAAPDAPPQAVAAPDAPPQAVAAPHTPPQAVAAAHAQPPAVATHNAQPAAVATHPATVAAPQSAPAAAPLPAPAASAGMRVRNAQIALKRLGYDPGPIDNRYGRLTRIGILRFQRAQRLRTTGILDRATWSAIVAQLIGNGN